MCVVRSLRKYMSRSATSVSIVAADDRLPLTVTLPQLQIESHGRKVPNGLRTSESRESKSAVQLSTEKQIPTDTEVGVGR